MFYLKLYPDETRSGEVVTYNGDGGVDARDILYVFEDDIGDKNVVMYSGGDNQSAGDALMWMYISPSNLNHYFMWQGDTSVESDPTLWFFPITPDQQEGHCHAVFYATAVSQAGEAQVLVDLDQGDDDTLRLQMNADYQGIRRFGTGYTLSIQWKEDADVSDEHLVEMFRNINTDYAALFETDDVTTGTSVKYKDRMDLFGRLNVMGWLSVGSKEGNYNYLFPPGKPDPGTSLPGGVTASRNWLALYEQTEIGTTDPQLKWYSLKEGSNSTITYDSVDRSITIECDCEGSGGTVDVDVVNDVYFDTSSGTLKVTYTKLTVLAETTATQTTRSIGTDLEVVVDNDVTTSFQLRHQKQKIYVLDTDAAGALTAYHTGTECV